MTISIRPGLARPTFDMFTDVASSRSMGRRFWASTVTDELDRLTAAASVSPAQRAAVMTLVCIVDDLRRCSLQWTRHRAVGLGVASTLQTEQSETEVDHG